jgi:uncharacterized ferritin-like protein (DUF455 family)
MSIDGSCTPEEITSLIDAALLVLSTPNPRQKATYTHEFATMWHRGLLLCPTADNSFNRPPDKPARSLDSLPPGKIRNRGKGGSLQSRIAIIHSLCHIESWAIDLGWDIIARFGTDLQYKAILPRAFYDDFVTVAADEARHFLLLEQRLADCGAHYGDLPVHDALWDSAQATAHSLPARLAVEHAVHEARGLDILPSTIGKFRAGGDDKTADLLENTIYKEEITHCAAGVRWFKYLFDKAHNDKDMMLGWIKEARQFDRVELWFHHLVKAHFYGGLKPPFNTTAREEAGFEECWYLPLQSSTTT